MTQEDRRHAQWRAQFDDLGEEAVRMMDGESHAVRDDRLRFAGVWLKQQDDARAEKAAAKRDQREEETLRIARRALRSSYIANTIAFTSAAIAVVVFLVQRFLS